MSVPERRAMVERPGENLSVRRQCALLNLARSGVYRPGPVTGADDLAMMRRIDELHLKWPFYGSRRMVFELNQARHGKPKIFNTAQGAQFTSAAFTGMLEAAGIAISMDGRGRFMDNIFIERLWRSIKYEEVHLKAYADGREARDGIGSWMNFYNRASEHPSVYVVEEKKLCWPLTGPAGCLTVLRARSTIDLAASDASAARAKIQTPSGSG